MKELYRIFDNWKIKSEKWALLVKWRKINESWNNKCINDVIEILFSLKASCEYAIAGEEDGRASFTNEEQNQKDIWKLK